MEESYNWRRGEDFHIENSLKDQFPSNQGTEHILYIAYSSLGRYFCGEEQMDRSSANGYGGTTQSAQPGFSGPRMYEANTGNPATNYGGGGDTLETEFSGPTMYQANTVRGNVWSTGLFDCHEDETNGSFFAHNLVDGYVCF